MKQTKLPSIFVFLTLCSLIKYCICKIKSHCKNEQSITFRALYDVTKINFFCYTKDGTPTLNQSLVVHEFVCPGYIGATCVGETQRTLFDINVEHAWSEKDSVVYNHLNECNGVQHAFDIANLTPSLFPIIIVDDIQD